MASLAEEVAAELDRLGIPFCVAEVDGRVEELPLDARDLWARLRRAGR